MIRKFDEKDLHAVMAVSYTHLDVYKRQAQYAVDDSQKQLVAVKYVNENFDTDGNASYTYFDSENGEQETQDPSYFENMFEIYEKAKIVNFKR